MVQKRSPVRHMEENVARHMAGKKKPPLGSGERFAQLKKQVARKGVRDPGALAAYIGRAKYGKRKFAQLSAKGRKRG
jgi:hypothetical protein